MRINDPLFHRPSALELDGITADPFREEGPSSSTQIAPLLVAGLIAGGAALAGGAAGMAMNKRASVNSYDIKEEAFDNPYFRSSRSATIMERDNARNRTGPTAQSAQQYGIREYYGANLGPAERMQAAQLGAAAQGTAERAAQTTIDRGEDRQFRSGQAQLAAQLQEQAAGRGPSLAEGQLRQATDRGIRQQMAVAASGGAGANAALAQRNVAANVGQMQQQAAADAAQMRMQEQIAARQQLAGVLESGRAQDIGVAQSQAQLLQQVNLANQAAGNQFGLANMEALNQFALQRAQLEQQSRMQNMDAGNQFALQRAQLQQQAGLASQAQFNEMLARNTQNEQQTRLANMEAELRQRGMNDEQVRAFTQMQLAQEEAQRQAMMDKERLEVQQNAAMQGLSVQAHEGFAGRQQSIIGGMFGGIGAGAAGAVSDPRAKSGMKSMLHSKMKVEARADGGPVKAGAPYLVGERGPEVIVPKQNGVVFPNPMTGNANPEIGGRPLRTWGSGPDAPEAIAATNRQEQMDKKGLDLAIQRSVASDNLRQANNEAIALATRQKFEAEAKADAKMKEEDWKKKVAPIQQAAMNAGEKMGERAPMAKIDTPSISSPGPRTTLAQYLSQFGTGRY